MIAIPLIQKIAELFLILFTAAGLVKAGILKSEDSRVLSRLSLYFVTPCVIFNSFQTKLTPEIQQGLLAAILVACGCEALYFLASWLMKRFWHATEVERASVVFTNAGNLILPIVAYIMGPEWVIYVSGYILVFNILFWSFGLRMFDSSKGMDLKKILLNPNMIAAICGMICLFAGVQLSGPLKIAFEDVATMIGPLSMMITGMIVGSMNFRGLFENRRIWMVILLRMVITSGAAVLLVSLSGIPSLIPYGRSIVMIALLSATAPSASNINQMAIIYNKDAKYASAINVLTTLSCILTMPFWMMIYEMLVG